MQWWGSRALAAQRAGFNEGMSTDPFPPDHCSVTHQSQTAKVEKGAGAEQPSSSSLGAVHLHRASLKPSTVGIGNFQNQFLSPPKQAFENHVPQLRLYVLFTYISYLSPTYKAHELLLGLVCRKREARETVRDNPPIPQLT